MKKQKLNIALALVSSFFVSMFTSAQNTIVPCSSTEMTQNFLENASENDRQRYEESRQDLRSFTESYIANHPESVQNADRSVSFTIPVVFHVLHNGGSENISDEQILDAVDVLNRDYQKMNADTVDVVAPFQSIVADLEIEFKLAKVDPYGECTKGITRTQTISSTDPNASESDRINAVISAHGIWAGNKYLNIYVADQLGDGSAGYTYKPDNVHGINMNNGIHVLHNYVGTIGTSSVYSSRTLTHEIGHWLNLDHLWGATNSPGDPGNCAADDGIVDTPPTMGWTSCDLSGTTCGTDLDNVQNYMEYSYCSRMFTLGQKSKMHAALNSSVGGRSNLWSASNLTLTGVNNPDELCKADFKADRIVVCAGYNVSFTDLSFIDPSSWSWEFEGGTPVTSTDQNPVVNYDTPGFYKVKLTASDASNSAVEEKLTYIHVLDQADYPFSESFEYVNSISEEVWTVLNDDNNESFEISNEAAFTGNQSIRLNNFAQNGSYTDELVSTSLDLSAFNVSDEVSLTFRLANARRNIGNMERLRIYFSSDCGENWTIVKTVFGSSLYSETQNVSWTPSSQADWKSIYVENITSSYFVDGFRFKIEFESDGGNNVFIDDINLYSGNESDDPVGINKEYSIQNIYLSPNPSKDYIHVNFGNSVKGDFNISLYNSLGVFIEEKVKTAKSKSISFKVSSLEKGVYFLYVKNDEGHVQVLKALVY